jgi:hypothetical protein
MRRVAGDATLLVPHGVGLAPAVGLNRGINGDGRVRLS